MKIHLFHNTTLTEEHIDIHYRRITPLIDQIIDVASDSRKMTEMSGKNQKGEIVFFLTMYVYYFESVDKRTFAYLKQQVYEVQDSLTELEELLNGQGFIRINKSVVVNIYRIRSIVPEINMRVKAVLENNEELTINRNYKKGFQAFLQERRNLL